jgi:hypothetical protein
VVGVPHYSVRLVREVGARDGIGAAAVVFRCMPDEVVSSAQTLLRPDRRSAETTLGRPISDVNIYHTSNISNAILGVQDSAAQGLYYHPTQYDLITLLSEGERNHSLRRRNHKGDQHRWHRHADLRGC